MGQRLVLIGALAGDMIGSRLEYSGWKSTEFDLFTDESHFTDDSILTIAVADAILNEVPYQNTIQSYANQYPNADYGGFFRNWLIMKDPKPYNSYGNGSAMRVSPVGWAFDRLEDVLQQARESAMPTHDHPEGIKGAQAVALAIFMARYHASKSEIRDEIMTRFGYNLYKPIDEIRRSYRYDVTCQGSVPESISAFMESIDFTSAIRLAVSLGGDIDTIACIAGSIAEAFYDDIPDDIISEVSSRIPHAWMGIIESFSKQFA